MKLPAFMLCVMPMLLSGCDAVPTILNNRSPHPIRFYYHERSYQGWSTAFYIAEGKAQRLAREHWIQDIIGLQIVENGRRYSFDYSSLSPLRHACTSFLISRRLNFTPDCYLTYNGGGHVSASFAEPKNIAFQELDNGS